MNPNLTLDERYLRNKYSFGHSLTPIGGILAGVSRLSAEHTAPDFEIAVSDLDNLTKIFPHVSRPDGTDACKEPLGGAGADIDPELAWLRAVMEGLERYSGMAFKDEDFILATANELGDLALDLDTIPRCSEREYADPQCPYMAPDKNKKIRWVQGYSLVDKCKRLVPGAMSMLYFKPWVGENIAIEISTGTAAHTSLETALVSAICEVIERDSIALSWLLKIPLPRIEFTHPLPPVLAPNYGRLENSLVKQYFFDATTDIGIPTVYALQLLENQPILSQYVACATGFDAAACCAKTIRESAPSRSVFQDNYQVPDNVIDFRTLYDGAAFLGRAENRSAFEFLTNTPNRIALGDMGPKDAGNSDRERLNYLVKILASMDMDIVVVDMTTEELRKMGIWVVRAIIPGLMPMSSVQRARFLGHKRLHDYAKKIGIVDFNESMVNQSPQPFA
ncbi:MAG: hypothetical protein EOO52_15055 [Gammaproteobacteria bacterium]|nr:MAG: hypothetical protein EOO52_15055 [Gammaproteobacteria bacterium]